MSVIFFDLEEMANVAAVVVDRFEGDFYLRALETVSECNARAFRVRYEGRYGGATGHTAKELQSAMGRPDVPRAMRTVQMLRYNCAEADPTAPELEAMLVLSNRMLGRVEELMAVWGKR